MDDPLKMQVGGNHYTDMKIQPVEFCHANKLMGIESAVIKYVCRHRKKGGRVDIEKSIHLLNILLDLEYPCPTPMPIPSTLGDFGGKR